MVDIMPPEPDEKTDPPPLPWLVRPETKAMRWDRADFGYGGYYLYLFRDSAGTVLYVGVTGNPVERWRRHAQKKAWWPQVSCIEFDKVWREADALLRERVLIRTLAPLYNVRSAVRR